MPVYRYYNASFLDELPTRMTVDDTEFKRLKWRTRRGMLELDLLLMPFFDEMYQDLPEKDQRAYARLLDQDDPDLMNWLSRQSSPEDNHVAHISDYS